MTASTRDYRLAGPAVQFDASDDEVEIAVEREWFSPAIERKVLKTMMKRSNGPGLRHVGLWLALLVLSGILVVLTWGSWWVIPFLAVYGVVYSASDHRQHELSHGTPFRNRRLNEPLYWLCSFMSLRDPYYFRWSHARHHTETLHVGRDPEIANPRPPKLSTMVLDLFFLKDGYAHLRRLVVHASGRLTRDAEHLVPVRGRRAVYWTSRAYLVAIAVLIIVCVASGSLLPAMLVFLPRSYGNALTQVFNITQHAGLTEDVADHRLNTRTVRMNPVFRFLYFNMNYHVEHHIYPLVPFHALPQLHAAIGDQLIEPAPSILGAYREILSAVRAQARDVSYEIDRPLPTGYD